MSRATKALARACEKLGDVLEDTEYLHHDCELASAPLSQEDFNAEVDEHEGNIAKAKRELTKRYKRDAKLVLADLAALSSAANAVATAFPAVVEEQIESLDDFDYLDDLDCDQDGADF